MVALKAGCIQKPDVGKIIGLDGSMFSKNPVNATTDVAVVPTSTPVESNRGGLTTGAYAGIGVAGAAVLAILIVVCFIGHRKKQDRIKRDLIASGLDDRFGNGRNTVPVQGAFGDPYSSQGSPYQNVGMTNFREKPYGSPMNAPQQKDSYYPDRQYQRPLSTFSQHQQQGVQEIPPPVTYANYNQSRGESPAPAYSPAFSLQTDTPTHSPRSIANSTTRLHHPSLSIPNESSGLARSHLATESTTQPRPNVVGSSPPAAPSASNSVATGAPTFTNLPARHTRDLSSGRAGDDSITVDTRFDVDDESKKKAERQRLYQVGFKHRE